MQPRAFAVRVVHGDRQPVVVVRGEVDVYTAPRLWEPLEQLMHQGHRQIVLDLSALDFLDSTGMGVLVRATKRLRERNGDLTVRSPSPTCHRVLEITGLSRMLRIER